MWGTLLIPVSFDIISFLNVLMVREMVLRTVLVCTLYNFLESVHRGKGIYVSRSQLFPLEGLRIYFCSTFILLEVLQLVTKVCRRETEFSDSLIKLVLVCVVEGIHCINSVKRYKVSKKHMLRQGGQAEEKKICWKVAMWLEIHGSFLLLAFFFPPRFNLHWKILWNFRIRAKI